MRNRIALVLLCLSWPVCILHRFWNKYPERKVSWIVLDKTVEQDFRWYYVYNELWLSSTLVIVAFLICKRKTKDIRIALRSLVGISIADIINYWLWFRRNEYALFIEGLIMFVGTILIFKNDSTGRNNEKAH